MIICVCNNVNEKSILGLCDENKTPIENCNTISNVLNVSTICGRCKNEFEKLVKTKSLDNL